MANYRTSRVLPIIFVIVIIVIAIAALVSLARVIFFPGASSNPAVVDISRDSLRDTSVGHSVSMTVRGPIVADEKFYSYTIDISSSKREATSYNGYRDSVVERITLGNSVASYEEFVYALDKANLPKGDEFKGDKNDVRGICATGKVYEFKILSDNQSVKTLWTSTCKGSTGSLDANVSQLTSLFVKQIPDADALIKRVRL